MNPRHADRRRALDALYQADVMGIRPTAVLEQWREATGEAVATFTRELVAGVEEYQEDLDILIGETAHDWTVDRMAAVDRAILRLATYELMFRTDTPVAVAIDEAVDAAKELSTKDSGRFVNGVLGRIATEPDVAGRDRQGKPGRDGTTLVPDEGEPEGSG
ncbi:MAG TPA: transcription antitermination factor NusB [Actinomycetota bacterium]|jgi:N utilization substance protein B